MNQMLMHHHNKLQIKLILFLIIQILILKKLLKNVVNLLMIKKKIMKKIDNILN